MFNLYFLTTSRLIGQILSRSNTDADSVSLRFRHQPGTLPFFLFFFFSITFRGLRHRITFQILINSLTLPLCYQLQCSPRNTLKYRSVSFISSLLKFIIPYGMLVKHLWTIRAVFVRHFVNCVRNNFRGFQFHFGTIE